MARYKLMFKQSVIRDMRPLPEDDKIRIVQCFEKLSENPREHGCEKLSGAERYRYRTGVYRIIYEIIDNTLTVVVVKIGHRREVYR